MYSGSARHGGDYHTNFSTQVRQISEPIEVLPEARVSRLRFELVLYGDAAGASRLHFQAVCVEHTQARQMNERSFLHDVSRPADA